MMCAGVEVAEEEVMSAEGLSPCAQRVQAGIARESESVAHLSPQYHNQLTMQLVFSVSIKLFHETFLSLGTLFDIDRLGDSHLH
jgi:hypothetical protein